MKMWHLNLHLGHQLSECQNRNQLLLLEAMAGEPTSAMVSFPGVDVYHLHRGFDS